jgi:hypothetical protein
MLGALVDSSVLFMGLESRRSRKAQIRRSRHSQQLSTVQAGQGIVHPRPVKPDGLNWLGIFAGIAGILLLYAGTALALHSGTASAGPEASGLVILLFLGYVLLLFSAEAPFVLAIAYLITAVGLLQSRRWAWSLSFTLSILSLGLNLFQLLFPWPIGLLGSVTLLLSLLVLLYLTRSRVREFFRAQVLLRP